MVSRSPHRMVLRRLMEHRLAVFGLAMIVFLGLASAIGPMLTPFDPLFIDFRAKFAPPLTGQHILGGDELGRDLLTRLLVGGRVSLIVGLAAMTLSVTIGAIAGALAGYYGGWIDVLIMRFVDAVLSFPTIFLLLALAAFIKPNLFTITIIIGATAWMEVARIVRGQILSLREQEFVLAARSIGASNSHIIARQLLPNAVAPIVVAATLNIANAILLESYISFLGYGIQPPTASWGNMLNNAQSYFNTAPWVAIFPGVLITLAVTSFNFVGDGLRDALDPRLGKR
ncbi:MAG TPA: peptide ABC transporter permease [Chloroflexi bacterium]|nr:peptide ABC transporter permease [Chloroflexota bacterium]HCG29978.1 peptide ABC transporter permease [Chloroflexota bacterium]